MEDNLYALESKSIYIIREVKSRFKNPALLWSAGKDSTALLWLCRQAFFGKIPFKVIHIDTGYEFKEIYDLRGEYAKKLGIKLIIAKNDDADKKGITPSIGKVECCNARKTDALKKALKEHKIDAVLVGIRRDENGIRDKERYFSPRDKEFKWSYAKERNVKSEGDSPFISMQDAEFDGWNIFATDFGIKNSHVRIHPLLHWTEKEVWRYILKEDIALPSLYFAKNKKRYRSIGCKCCCRPIDSDADSVLKIIEELKTTKVLERSQRDQDKESEYNMQKLRSLGYM